MASSHPIIDQTFGRLSVVRRDYARGDCHYVCLCECGNLTSVRSHYLVHGRTSSCGCLLKEASTKRITERNKAASESYFDSPGEVVKNILLVLSRNPSGTLTSQINCGSSTKQHLYKLEAHKAIYRVADGRSFRWSLTQKGWDKVFCMPAICPPSGRHNQAAKQFTQGESNEQVQLEALHVDGSHRLTGIK